MALLASPIDYTDKDFDALEVRVNNLITSVFPNWTDRNVANFGNILVDLFCFVGDVTTKYQDAQALETRWSTATQRKNLLALVSLIGYQPSGVTAAQATETFTLSAPASASVTIPAGDVVTTLDVGGPIAYQLLADLVIPSGITTMTATVENSSNVVDVFASTGLPNQNFTATQPSYIDASAVVSAGDGAYTQVANFLNSGPTDRHFVLGVDSTSTATVYFGNGVLGAIPQGSVSLAYKVGGGSAGRVEANALQKLPKSYTDAHGHAVSIAVNNLLSSSGGLDAETNAQIQTLAPLSLRTLTRSIATDDFSNVALQVPGVARALMTTSNEDPGVPENRGILYVVPPGAVDATTDLLSAVAAEFSGFPYPSCFKLLTQGANYLDVDVVVKAYRRAGVTPAQLKAAVLATLGDLFADTLSDTSVFDANGDRLNPPPTTTSPNPDSGKPNPLIDFGYNLQNSDGVPDGSFAWSFVFEAVGGIPQVRKVGSGADDVTLNGARADVPIGINQFPRLGSVVVIDGDTDTVL